MCAPKDLELHDNKGRLDLSRVNGDIHWAPAGSAQPRGSTLSWAAGGAYGLSGGAAQLEFLLQGISFALTRPTKLPVFDGAHRHRHVRDRQSRRRATWK